MMPGWNLEGTCVLAGVLTPGLKEPGRVSRGTHRHALWPAFTLCMLGAQTHCPPRSAPPVQITLTVAPASQR